MKNKIIVGVVLFMLMGCTLVDPDIKNFESYQLMGIGFTINEEAPPKTFEDKNFFILEYTANVDKGNASLFTFDPFEEGYSNPIEYFYEEGPDNKIMRYERLRKRVYLNDLKERPTGRISFYAAYVLESDYSIQMIRPLDEGSIVAVALTPDLMITSPTLESVSLHSTDVVKNQIHIYFDPAPKFQSITITDSKDDGTIVLETKDASSLNNYIIQGDQVIVKVQYLDEKGAPKVINKVITNQTIQDSCYVGSEGIGDNCDYRYEFDYLVNGTEAFAKRMRISFRSKE